MTSGVDSSAPARAWPRLLIVGSFLPGFDLSRYAGGNLAVEIIRGGGKVITTSRRRWRPLRLADMLRTIRRRRGEYDLAHVTVFSNRAFIYAECVVALLCVLGKRCTLGLHGGNLPVFAGHHPTRTRRLLNRSSVAVCPSRYLFEELNSFGKELHLIPNALHIAKYSCKARRFPGRRLLWLRAFHAIYNPEMAIAMFSRVVDAIPDASMTMIGPDKGDGTLQATKKMAKDLGLLERISFPGAISKEDVPKVMTQHDVFVNTTNVDNTPVSIVEAMACGLPVVSTNVGGIPYLLEHGKTGLLVSPGDAGEMAGAVRRLLSEPQLAQDLGDNGRKLAESFDWNVVLPQWQKLFARLIPAKVARES